jgi:hypothetical protein
MNPMPTHQLGRIEFVPYDKFPTGTSPAPSALELARLYDRAAEQVALLVYALRLSTPRNQLALDAREAALAAVEFDLQSPPPSNLLQSQISNLQSS